MERFFDSGRKQELDSLDQLYKRDEFTFAVIYGRRRVGKTVLINEFIARGNKKAIRFTATDDTNLVNLENFSQSIFATYPKLSSLGSFRSWEAALDFIVKEAEGEKLIIFIDEYPYLAKAYPPISSQLQRHIDLVLQKTNIMLILCGSSMSFMESQVLGYQSPLYGRRTSQYKIGPFDYFDSAEFFYGAGFEEKLLGYAVTNGIPKYLNAISNRMGVEEGVNGSFFSRDGYLYEEPYNLLKQELREPAVYNAIISAIANGATRLSVISAKVGEVDSKVANYTKNLIDLGIVSREVPVLSSNEKNGIYTVKDSMYRFWYRYVPKTKMLIESGHVDIYEKQVKPNIEDFMGPVFEDVCMQYLMRLNVKNKLPFLFTQIGRWWGGNPLTKKETEIDIIAASTDKDKIIMGECKWRNRETGTDVLIDLKEKAALFPDKEIHTFVFSRSDFTAGMKKEAEKNENLTLVGLDDLFRL